MGFGPRLWSRQRGEVEYGIRAFPLGAFVRIVGMNNLDDCPPEDEPRAYRSKSFPRKMLVITAGSLAQFVLAFLLFAGTFATTGQPGETGKVTVAMLGMPAGGGMSAAMEAGILPGDVIVSIDGVDVTTQRQFTAIMGAYQPGDAIEVVIQRGSETLVVVPTLKAAGGRAMLGVGVDSYGWRSVGPVEAVGAAASDVVSTVVHAVRGVFIVFNPVNLASNVTADVADPETRPSTVVGATQVGGRIGQSQGLPGVLLVLASVNVVFAVINLFPLLPFDGGHAAIATYERLRSRKGRTYHADAAKMANVAMVTLVVLLAVFAVGLYLDITQPIG
jgi:membrane-associated protease RseP (regulator of RpoE activity)